MRGVAGSLLPNQPALPGSQLAAKPPPAAAATTATATLRACALHAQAKVVVVASHNSKIAHRLRLQQDRDRKKKCVVEPGSSNQRSSELKLRICPTSPSMQLFLSLFLSLRYIHARKMMNYRRLEPKIYI